MAAQLVLTAALRAENTKGEQFALCRVESGSRTGVTKTPCGQMVLKVFLIVRGCGAHGVDVRAENRFLRRYAGLKPGLLALGSGREIPRSARTSLMAVRAASALPTPI